jgi:hypothetical protein
MDPQYVILFPVFAALVWGLLWITIRIIRHAWYGPTPRRDTLGD